MKKVLIPTKLDSIAAEILRTHGGYAVVQDAKTPLPELAAAHPDAHALVVRSEKVTAAIMEALPQLRVIVRAGAGFDTIDTKYARKRGVDVMNTPGANANAVAEEVVALMLADARFIVPADASVRRGEWEKKAFMGREITGKTVGIVGLGNIGRLVVRRLHGFDCRMLGYDPLVSIERAREFGVEPVDFIKTAHVNLKKIENLSPAKALETIRENCEKILEKNKFIFMLGGEHSVSIGNFQALAQKYNPK